jgi:DNA adenine methylase
MSLKPFLKWAGGKRWFVTNHADILPNDYNRYIEPFLGSGAVYFHLNPRLAILGDSNPELIATYSAIKTDWKLVRRYLLLHQKHHSREYYYKLRSSALKSPASRAARFIYLNRTCWNGLYRVNQKGIYNVPIGTRSTVIFDDDCFEEISVALQNAQLYSCDFERLINEACEDDLVFVDPPYTVRHNHNAFIKYNEKLFSWQDQLRLFNALKRARNRGAKIISTNAYHSCIKNLYRHDFATKKLSRASGISSNKASRGKYEELLISS